MKDGDRFLLELKREADKFLARCIQAVMVNYEPDCFYWQEYGKANRN